MNTRHCHFYDSLRLCRDSHKVIWLLLFFIISWNCSITESSNIKGPPVVSADYLERYVAQEGDTVKILCPITGTPKPLIEWYQDDRMIPPTWVRFRINRRYIKIKDVVLADTGSYVCKGINGFGSESVALHLVVRDLKEVLKSTNEDHSGPYRGLPPYLTEELPNSFTANNGFPLQGSSNEGGSRNGNRGPLVFDSSKYEEPRMVQQTAVRGDGIHKMAGDTLKLECLVDGSPAPSITWYKNGDIVMNPNLQSGRSQTILLIPDLDPFDDSGEYICKARNVWGEVNATFPVIVHGASMTPQILGPTKLNRTLDLGDKEPNEAADKFYLQCEVLSLGQTQIQWLKQIPDKSFAKNKNKTVEVFDYVFEIVPTTIFEKGADGFYNASLLINVKEWQSTVQGRYICLVNNPDGHAYKEVFLHLKGASAWQSGSHNSEPRLEPHPNSISTHQNSEPMSGSISMALVISVPLISLTLLCGLLFFAFCVRRSNSSGQNKAKDGSSKQLRAVLHVNPLNETSPYATSLVDPSPGKTGSNSTTDWLNTCKALQGSPFQPLRPHHWQPLSADKDEYVEIAIQSSSKMPSDPGEEEWVEVSNKANQTPSHWVYSDMISGNSDLIYPLLDTGCNSKDGTFNTYLMENYSFPKDNDSALCSASTSLANSPLVLRQPRKPYLAGLAQQQRVLGGSAQHLYQNTGCRPVCPGSPLTASVGRSPHHKLTTPVFHQSKHISLKDIHPEYFAVLKTGSERSMSDGKSGNGRQQVSTDIYSRPPSDHFYFKIQDGKTEFL